MGHFCVPCLVCAANTRQVTRVDVDVSGWRRKHGAIWYYDRNGRLSVFGAAGVAVPKPGPESQHPEPRSLCATLFQHIQHETPNLRKKSYQSTPRTLKEKRRRLCAMNDSKRQVVKDACAKKRARASRSALRGTRRFAWRAVQRQSGGQSPSFYVLDIDSHRGGISLARWRGGGLCGTSR